MLLYLNSRYQTPRDRRLMGTDSLTGKRYSVTQEQMDLFL